MFSNSGNSDIISFRMLIINILSTIRRLPSLSNMPDNAIMAMVAGLVFLTVLFFCLAILMFTGSSHTEKEEHHLPDSHKLIADLQKTLINEMKGTSKQNSLMIKLTVLFIIITIIGMIIGIIGPAKTMKIFNEITGSVKVPVK